LRWRWSLSGREGLGSSLPPAERASAGFRRFRENEMSIFHYARSRKSNGNQTEANVVTVVTGRSTGRSTGRCTGRGHCATDASGQCPVTARFSVAAPDARRVRSQATGRVRWSRELTGLPPDAVTVASGLFTSASGGWFVLRDSVLTGASGGSRDRRVRW
jgi:hypothetical protein